MPQLLSCVCETVKDEALALIDSTRHMSQGGETVEDEDSMETDSPRGPQKDQRDGVSQEKRKRQAEDFVSDVSNCLEACMWRMFLQGDQQTLDTLKAFNCCSYPPWVEYSS